MSVTIKQLLDAPFLKARAQQAFDGAKFWFDQIIDRESIMEFKVGDRVKVLGSPRTGSPRNMKDRYGHVAEIDEHRTPKMLLIKFVDFESWLQPEDLKKAD